MTVRSYKSTDASAPVLSGTTGSLNDLLQAILVDGYGATVAAGWTREYNDATSKTMVWRPAAGPRHYLQSQDNGPGAGTYKEARWRGYETMSAYNAGTGPFPTSAQQTNGLFVRKSTTADSTARAWRAWADNKTIHLWINSGDATHMPGIFSFGAFNSWKSADGYASYIVARLAENSTGATQANIANSFHTSFSGASTYGFAPRSYTAVGSSVALMAGINPGLGLTDNLEVFGTTGQTYPNPVDGGLLMSPIYIRELGLVRGTVRGLWCPGHPKPLLDLDTFSALDGATTRNFEACDIAAAGQMFVETSDTWDTA